MNARRPPPPRASRLGRALERLSREVARQEVDPDLSERVLRALPPAPRPPAPRPHPRTPGARGPWPWLRWVGLLGLLLAAAGDAHAGPVEAREAWQRAQALKSGPWVARVRALRDARAATVPSDSLYARALKAEASAWRAAGRVHAAAAAGAWASGLGPDADPDRAEALLSLARALRDEGDDAAARDPLLAAARVARAALPWKADEALDLLVEDADERGDEGGLAALALRLEQERARPSSRIEALGRLGLVALGRGARDEAGRCLARAERAYRESARAADPREVARSIKAWLDSRLRRALASR